MNKGLTEHFCQLTVRNMPCVYCMKMTAEN